MRRYLLFYFAGMIIDMNDYLVDPCVCLEADTKTDCEEEASVPVDQDQDVHHNLDFKVVLCWYVQILLSVFIHTTFIIKFFFTFAILKKFGKLVLDSVLLKNSNIRSIRAIRFNRTMTGHGTCSYGQVLITKPGIRNNSFYGIRILQLRPENISWLEIIIKFSFMLNMNIIKKSYSTFWCK